MILEDSIETDKDQSRLVSPKESDDMVTLRPQSLSEFIGQDRLKDNLRVFMEAAQKQGESLDHVLLSGPPGLGKTTLASIMAKEMRVHFKVTSGPSIEKAGDLAALLSQLESHDILFIDEIHRLPRTVEEILYSAMEDFKLDLMIGEGPSARSLRLDIPRFTLIGATTRSGLLSSPLRSRFGIPLHLEFYTNDQLATIVRRSAHILKIEIDTDGSLEIARRSRRTPRIANRLLRRVRDFAIAGNQATITRESADYALSRLDVDLRGLDTLDRRLLNVIIEQFDGGPVGIDTLGACLQEERDTIEELCEPFLLQEGFLARTPRGRLATEGAYTHLQKSRKIDLPLFAKKDEN